MFWIQFSFSGSQFFLVPIVVLLLMQLLCGKLPSSLFLNFSPATGPSAKKNCPLKSTTGGLITNSNKQLERSVEHYSVLYVEPHNIRATALTTTPCFDTVVELDVIPTMSELKVALKHTSAGKAPGIDEIPADLLKCDNRLLPHLYHLLCTSWHSGKFQSAMKDAKIVTLFKKGDKGDCNNNRGISLLRATSKVFTRVLPIRPQKLADRIYPEFQCVFSSGRSIQQRT